METMFHEHPSPSFGGMESAYETFMKGAVMPSLFLDESNMDAEFEGIFNSLPKSMVNDWKAFEPPSPMKVKRRKRQSMTPKIKPRRVSKTAAKKIKAKRKRKSAGGALDKKKAKKSKLARTKTDTKTNKGVVSRSRNAGIEKVSRMLRKVDERKAQVRAENPGVCVLGVYTPEERKKVIEKYRAKRRRRSFEKKIMYSCRANIGVKRVRVRGRFVKSDKSVISFSGKNNEKETATETATPKQVNAVSVPFDMKSLFE